MYDSETHQQTRAYSCTVTSRYAATFTGSILNNCHGVVVPVCVVNQLLIIVCTPTFACRSAVSVYEMAKYYGLVDPGSIQGSHRPVVNR